MILSTIEYQGGRYELRVLTATKAAGRAEIYDYLKADGLGMSYYGSINEMLDDLLCQDELTIGKVDCK